MVVLNTINIMIYNSKSVAQYKTGRIFEEYDLRKTTSPEHSFWNQVHPKLYSFTLGLRYVNPFLNDKF